MDIKVENKNIQLSNEQKLSNEQTLSNEQKLGFEKYRNGENVFLTGPGGSGKSALIKMIYDDATKRNKNIQVCALTGCAAVLLGCKAKTIHSWAHIGIATDDIKTRVEKVINIPFAFSAWKKIQILVIDEVSMMSQKIFELLDAIGKRIRHNNLPFGGIQLIFSGDFYQLPPIPNNNSLNMINDVISIDLSANFCFESPLWFETFSAENHIQFKTIFRQNDTQFKDILNQIRIGKIKKKSVDILNTRLTDTNQSPLDCKLSLDCAFKPTKILPLRYKVDFINATEMQELTKTINDDTAIKEYKVVLHYDLPMTTKEVMCRRRFNMSQIEHEAQYMKNNLRCEENLRLCVGCQVMCIVNKDNLYNGLQGIITAISTNGHPIVTYVNGLVIEMSPHVWKSENIPGIGVSQIPLILAWALTIHKLQGATLETAEVDVGSGIFECGQTYVALSRVKSLDGLNLQSFDVSKIYINKKVKDFYDLLYDLLHETKV